MPSYDGTITNFTVWTKVLYDIRTWLEKELDKHGEIHKKIFFGFRFCTVSHALVIASRLHAHSSPFLFSCLVEWTWSNVLHTFINQQMKKKVERYFESLTHFLIFLSQNITDGDSFESCCYTLWICPIFAIFSLFSAVYVSIYKDHSVICAFSIRLFFLFSYASLMKRVITAKVSASGWKINANAEHSHKKKHAMMNYLPFFAFIIYLEIEEIFHRNRKAMGKMRIMAFS